jgi:hypothetical protein
LYVRDKREKSGTIPEHRSESCVEIEARLEARSAVEMESFRRIYEGQIKVSRAQSDAESTANLSGLGDVASIISSRGLIRDFVNKRGFLFLSC